MLLALATPRLDGLQSDASLRVMSFNIRFGTANDGPDRWEVRAPRTYAVIRDHNPDILGLQEALDFQIDQIRANIPGYETVGVGRDDGKKAGEHSPILFRTDRFQLLASGTFWLSDQPDVVASKTWGNQITRICTWAQLEDRRTDKTFWVFNTHFDHQSQPSREKSAALVLQRIREKTNGQPVLITGDFNAGESNPAILAIKQGGFQDTWRLIHPDAPEPGTFNAFRDDFGSSKIDYVFVDQNWKTLAAEVVLTRIDGRWPSDHMPVTATVQLR